MWVSTTPFKFSLPLRFVSRFDAYKEVFLPVMGLLSFMYPRLSEEEKEYDTADVLSQYFIPGPNIFYNLKNPEGEVFNLGGGGGDRVEISMGHFMSFSGCYLTSIGLTIENSFNVAGFPHNVAAQVDFEAMDVSFVNFDGGFMENGLGNQALVLNKDLVDAYDNAKKALEGKEGVAGFVQSISNVFKPLLNP
jgi:hypothetical protein